MLPSSHFGWLGLAAGAILLAGVPLLDQPYYVDLATYACIAGMLALSLQLLVGCTGLVSLGHSAFYGLAAYTVYLATPEGSGHSILLTLPLAMAVAGVAAFFIGSLSLRTRGFFFLMVTLAFCQMLFFVFHDTKLGGGSDGAYLARPTLGAFGFELRLSRSARPIAIYYVTLALMLAMYLGLARLMRSLFGRVLDGIRTNEHRMQSIGFDTYRYKLAAFTLAGVLAGAAGHMWAMKQGAVNPELLSWHRSAEALLMILLGGLGSLAGPIVGALAFTGLGEVPELAAEWKPFSRLFGAIGLPGLGAALQAAAERKVLVQGVVILIAVLVLPKGIMGIKLSRLKRKPVGHATKVPAKEVAAP